MVLTLKTKSFKFKDLIGKKDRDPLKRPFAVIVRCSEICNYLCSYCYAEHNSNVPIMPIKTARSIIEKVLEYVSPRRRVHFVWHGGEPLFAGFDFFEKVMDICNEYKNYSIKNSIQTNGSLLTQEFTEFCIKNNISISLSLDGPEEIHNSNRKDKKGKGTFNKTLRAINILKKYNLKVYCVCVLHKKNIKRIKQLYNFFKTNNINIRLNPIVRAGNAINVYNSLAITAKEYGNAMCKLFDLWFDDDSHIRIEPLHTLIGNIIFPTIWGCDFHGKCLASIISINPDGNIYPCGRFEGLENFLIGNINKCKNLNTLFNSKIYKELLKRTPDSIKRCSMCEFVEICNGGCMVTAYMSHSNIYDADYYCLGRKMIFKHIILILKLYLNRINS